jgi:choline kinase
MRAAGVVLAAGMGTRLRPHTEKVPKCLVPLGGRPLLEQALSSLHAAGVERAVVVCGYRAETLVQAVDKLTAPIAGFTAECAENADFASTGTAASLLVGLQALRSADWTGEVVVAEGDIWFGPDLVALLADQGAADVVAVDRRGVGGEGSLLRLNPDATVRSWHFLSDGGVPPEGELHRLGNVYRFSAATWRERLVPALEEAVAQTARLPLEVFLQAAGNAGLRLRAVPVSACRWWEVDTEADLAAAHARCIDGLPAEDAIAVGRRAGGLDG